MKVYVVIRHERGYYVGEYYINLEGVFSSKEKADEKTGCFALRRFDMNVHEIEIDKPETEIEIYAR